MNRELVCQIEFGMGKTAEAALVKPSESARVDIGCSGTFPLFCGLVIGLFIFFRDFFSHSSVAITADTSFHSPTWKSKTKELFLEDKMSPLNVLTLEE